MRLLLAILYTPAIGIVMACSGGLWMSQLADIGAWWGLISVAMVPLEARMTAPVVCFLRDTFANCRYWLLRLCGKFRIADEAYRTLITLSKD